MTRTYTTEEFSGMAKKTKRAYHRKSLVGWEKARDKELGAQNEHIQTMKKDNPHGCGADAKARYLRSLGIVS